MQQLSHNGELASDLIEDCTRFLSKHPNPTAYFRISAYALQFDAEEKTKIYSIKIFAEFYNQSNLKNPVFEINTNIIVIKTTSDQDLFQADVAKHLRCKTNALEDIK